MVNENEINQDNQLQINKLQELNPFVKVTKGTVGEIEQYDMLVCFNVGNEQAVELNKRAR